MSERWCACTDHPDLASKMSDHEWSGDVALYGHALTDRQVRRHYRRAVPWTYRARRWLARHLPHVHRYTEGHVFEDAATGELSAYIECDRCGRPKPTTTPPPNPSTTEGEQ